MKNSWVFIIGTCMIYVGYTLQTGGWTPVTELNSPRMLLYGTIATKNLTRSINSPYYLKLMNITKAHKQIVSGVNYKMEIHIGPSECRRFGNYTEQEFDDCPLQKCDNPLICTVFVWVQPWKKDGIKLTRSFCEHGDSFC